MDMPMKLLGQTIKAARKQKKMTQVELADALNMSESYITTYDYITTSILP